MLAKDAYLPCSYQHWCLHSFSVVASHFSARPAQKIIVTDAKGSKLASILLLANLHERTIHITGVHGRNWVLSMLSQSPSSRINSRKACVSVFWYWGDTSSPLNRSVREQIDAGRYSPTFARQPSHVSPIKPKQVLSQGGRDVSGHSVAYSTTFAAPTKEELITLRLYRRSFTCPISPTSSRFPPTTHVVGQTIHSEGQVRPLRCRK